MFARPTSTRFNLISRWLSFILMCFASNVFAGQITLAWDPSTSTNVMGYHVVYGQSSGSYTEKVDVGNTTKTTINNLDDSKNYYFAVRAYAGSGDNPTAQSAASNEVSKLATTQSSSSTTLPHPWISMDIGNVGQVGSVSYLNGSYTVKGSGADIWGSADAFHFAYQPLSGDGSIVARVVSVSNTNYWAKAGVMIRESLDANARHAMAAVTRGNGVTFLRRTTTGGGSESTTGVKGGIPYWVKLTRVGNTFTAYQSANGTSWVQVGSTTINMASSAFIGLALTSHNNSALNTSVLDNVSVVNSKAGDTNSTAIQYTFDSQPSGLSLIYDGASRVTPFTVDVEAGSQHSISALTSQSNYTFDSWSDGGTATHTITIGTSAQTLTANYAATIPAPTAGFSTNQSSGNTPLSINFTDQSSGSVTSWAWTFGDGSSSTAQNPSHIYTAPGTYSVSLTVMGSGGSSTTTQSDYIVVKEAKPTASFTASPNSGAAPLLVTLIADASTGGSIDSYAWTFSDNTTASGSKVVKTFDAGTHIATLTVTGPSGSATVTQTITATTAAAPMVDFSASPTRGAAPLAVSFLNSSSDDIQSWSWNFGDGGTSTAQNPVYTYTKAGTYTVSLTATTSTGSKVTKTLSNYITIDANNNTPVACASTSNIWPGDAAPAGNTNSDTNGVELGVKFRSDVDGYICGVRFYKFSTNTGTHVGSLWNIDGQLLARATFANETASGWQQVSFDQPVAVKANTVYVASYYAPNGQHAVDTGYFTKTGVDNGVLHALRDGESGSNSVYLYGGGFPTYSWQSSNYWVDVVFSTGASSWLEAGEITLNGGWQQVKFAKPFSDPVVVANPLNYDAAEPGVIRIRNVSATGFEIRSQAWDYLGGSSIAGKVSYLVMERGSHTLEDGTQVEAGRIDTDLTSRFGQVAFTKAFSVAPVVITGVASTNEESAVVTRVQSITSTGFYVGMQEEEANARVHATETIAYIAWQPSSGTVQGWDFQVSRANSVTDQFYTLTYPKATAALPMLLADMQTTNSGDTVNLRWKNKSQRNVQIKIAEEQSKDKETRHSKETVGYILLTPKQ